VPVKSNPGLFARVLTADAGAPPDVSILSREITLPSSLQETFAFFADAVNLERLTPGWLNFRILTAMPVTMCQGVEIRYRVGLYGVPIPWVSRIDVWEPGVRFVDRQLVGPYRWWHHTHGFEEVADGTRVTDRVEYKPRAEWLSGSLVRRDLDRIFTYRHAVLREIFKLPRL
jgi:ligand-binding SRPBCC domain-containing protein